MKELIGRMIVDVRHLTPVELRNEGWEDGEKIEALVLDDGKVIYASGDGEANYPGVLFGFTSGQEESGFYVLVED